MKLTYRCVQKGLRIVLKISNLVFATKLNSMHNLKSNFDKFCVICKKIFKDAVNKDFNFRTYPVKPKMNDISILALSCCMESLGIDSENLLWSKLQTDYATDFPDLIDRTRFNRRRRRLQPQIARIQDCIALRLTNECDTMIIDSVPVPVIKLARETSYKICKQDYETAPAKGYSAVNKGWFIGYKLHLVIFGNGVVQQSGITKGNVHDINYLKSIETLPSNKDLLGDRAFLSKTVQLNLFENFEVRLRVPFRSNQYAYKKYPKNLKGKRQMIETVFAQLCDQFNLKRNYAKTYSGILTRLSSKVSAISILNFINFTNGVKLSRLKHALSF